MSVLDKYEYRVKTEQMLEYVETKQYKKAMEIADTIDWRRVKNATMLSTVSEIYEYNGEFLKSRDMLFLAYDRAPGSRKIVYRLGILALKIGDTEEASDCYEEFVKLVPRDPNQYILKYKILSAQNAPVVDQIAALEEFKKAEYVEKWAYELACLYEKAGMLAECLEECDDLILWFSEGKYVYQAMELKMKYKPLTPLQQEKYDSRPGAAPKREVEPEILKSVQTFTAQPEELPEEPVEEEVPAEEPVMEEPEAVEVEEAEEEIAVQEPVEEVLEEVAEFIEEATEEELVEEPVEAPVVEEEKPAKASAITKVVSGATLKEALEAAASGMKADEAAMAAKDEQLRISGLMKIDDILLEWEEKQKVNAEAIEKQRVEDEERIRKEREAAKARQEAERLEIERKAAEAAKKRAEEEAARKAEEEAAKKAAEEAARKAEEEAARKAAEEEAAKKAAEEAARKAEEEAAKKAAEEEEAKRAAIQAAIQKAKEENKKLLNEKTQRLPDDILQLVEQLESRVADPKAKMKDEVDEELAELTSAIEEYEEEREEEVTSLAEHLDGTFEDEFAIENEPEEYEEAFEEAEYEEEDFEEENFDEYEAEDFETEDFEEENFDEYEEAYEEEDFEEENFDEYEEEAYEEEDFEEENFDEYEEEAYGDFEEEYDDFDEYDDEAYEEEYGDAAYEEEDFGEEDFEEDFEEADFDEEEFDEDDFDEYDTDATEFEEDEFGTTDEMNFDPSEFFGDVEEEEEPVSRYDGEPLEIEEPSEEEIQKRIKKSKGGVPFDTGFVVTGRYDLSATSEIGLKAGLTEEQKKLFSYFVPVRGMSEQIVEVLDNDRRAQREGTSKTGNILVVGHKGSGKTVLSVDMVKAIQKQRNLKQGKLAIVTGESLNKKELSNIIQKLRGGAIIIEKAGKLNTRTIKELNYLMEKKTGEMLFVLEDQRKPLERIMTANPDFKRKFTSRLELPVFINDELVTFGQTYAKENGYKLDEMGILALYSRIDVMQREDHAVSVAEVKEIMDEAIAHSQKANVKHLARRVFKRSTDESDRIILKEEDFRV